jgi:hypothetical protein
VVVSSSICFWLIVRTHGAAEVEAITGLILLFNGAWLAHYLGVRADLFATSGEGVDAFVALTRKRLAVERRWMRIARRWTLVICAAVVPVLVWILAVRWDRYLQEPWRGVVGVGVAASIFVGVFVWMGHKDRKLRTEQERFERYITHA